MSTVEDSARAPEVKGASRRGFLVGAIGVAATANFGAVPAVSSELRALMDAHTAAVETQEAALGALWELEERIELPRDDVQVGVDEDGEPVYCDTVSWLYVEAHRRGGDDPDGWHAAKKQELLAARAAKADALRRSGLPQARAAVTAAEEAEQEAARRICAYRPTTLYEAAERTRYLTTDTGPWVGSIPNHEELQLFFASLIGAVMGRA